MDSLEVVGSTPLGRLRGLKTLGRSRVEEEKSFFFKNELYTLRHRCITLL
jgi:hypothetical protein